MGPVVYVFFSNMDTTIPMYVNYIKQKSGGIVLGLRTAYSIYVLIEYEVIV